MKFDKYLFKNFELNGVNYNIFKGNILNEIDEIKKGDGTPFKVFTPYWRNAERFYLDKIPSIEKKISKCKKKITFFKKIINEKEILHKDNWSKKFEKYWAQSEDKAYSELKNFIKDKIENYSEARNFPSLIGTSKLSPYIKHGQIHVETIWEECIKFKKKGIKE